MTLTDDLVAEIRFLSLFNLASHQEGLKVHHTADAAMIGAARRLHEKGLIDQVDGGYLTDLGIEAAEHAQRLLTVLTSRADGLALA
ncbi:MAG: TIGR02647 family protein [Methylomonas sp.]|nr:TIGR02647 family protein [Methylomonas sp.]PPD20259.1 MAG: TIGR02647 family protein [Methylomonas sp.]PPD25178.1 MAG: TIGR02647 family protein [Methylomonas sp.]PPD34808.1 MAG: TIGR02647 family protein [Methylomonas sp.]PPD41195.1 MAG: TIGR02647 family protein [Methylomonas sp.]